MHSFLNSFCGQLPYDASSESKMALAGLSQWNIYGSKSPGDASYGNVYNNIVFIQRRLWCAQSLLQTLYTSSAPPVKQVGGKNESCLQMSKRNTEQDSTEVHSGVMTEQEPPCLFKGARKGIHFIMPRGIFLSKLLISLDTQCQVLDDLLALRFRHWIQNPSLHAWGREVRLWGR